MMLKFHCHSCSEAFRISIKQLHDKETIKCNNCGQSLPDEAVTSLNKLGESYLDVIDALHKTGSHNNCWSISIEEDSQLYPKPVSEFDELEFSYHDRKEESYWYHRNALKQAVSQEIF